MYIKMSAGQFNPSPEGWRTFSPEMCLEHLPSAFTGAGFSCPQRCEQGHGWKMTRFTPRLNTVHEGVKTSFISQEKTRLLVFLQGEKGYSQREELITFPCFPESPHISAVQKQPVWTNKWSNQQETIKQSLHYWARNGKMISEVVSASGGQNLPTLITEAELKRQGHLVRWTVQELWVRKCVKKFKIGWEPKHWYNNNVLKVDCTDWRTATWAQLSVTLRHAETQHLQIRSIHTRAAASTGREWSSKSNQQDASNCHQTRTEQFKCWLPHRSP